MSSDRGPIYDTCIIIRTHDDEYIIERYPSMNV